MLRSIVLLFNLLTPNQKKRLFSLQFLVILMAFAEIVGVASIGPFMALVGDVKILEGDNLLAQLYSFSGLVRPEDFIFWIGLAALFLLAVGTMASMYAIWRLSLFSFQTGTEIGDRLFNYYMHQPWLYHAAGNSAVLTKQIATEADRVTNNIITPLMQMNARLIMAFFMILGISFYNPLIMILGLVIFGFAYLVLYLLVKVRLTQLGQIVSTSYMKRFQMMMEGFGGIKDVLLLGRQKGFTDRFESNGKSLSNSLGTNAALIQLPRYFMELVAYGTVIFLVLYLSKSSGGDLSSVLPGLAVYSLAGLKLLPIFQTTYGSIAQIKSTLPSFEAIKKDLNDSQNYAQEHTSYSKEKWVAKEYINLNAIEFTYPGKTIPVLNQLNWKIPVGKVVGLVGSSGAGKSTAIDVLLGLIKPDKGKLLIDGKPLNQQNTRAWQNTLGFVPQSIFLSDTSIMENIAFGLPRDEIDVDRVKQVIRLAHLDELIQELPQGHETIVGERGVQLSGGQRQRIGIARALYSDVDILILDEATSALDGITEKLVMDAIYDFSGSKTLIIIAHRITTIQKCDTIYFMDQGKIIDSGSYDELMVGNPTFQEMALSVKVTD